MKFVYNNAKNASIDYTSFEIYFEYFARVLFENKINFCLRSCFANKLAKKLKKLIKIYY